MYHGVSRAVSAARMTVSKAHTTQTKNGDSPASHTPAHDVTATVASFRTWRGSQLVIAGGPTGLPLSSLSERAALSRNDAPFASEPLNQQATLQRLNHRLPIRQHPLTKLLRRHRPANQIALRLITAE